MNERKMVRKAKTKLQQTEKKSKTSKSRIRKKKRQIILDKLQQIALFHLDNPNDSDRTVLSCAQNVVQTSPGRKSRLIETDVNRNDAYDYTCYRCQHFIEIPRNLSVPFCKTTPAFIERCEAELKFCQAIIWLKSAAASVSQVSIEQLRQIFNKQWNEHDDALNSSVISNRSCNITSGETISQPHTIPENVQSEIFNFTSMNNPNKLLKETLTPERYTSYTIENKRETDSLSKYNCTIPETDEEYSSSLNDMFQSPCVSNNVPENQNECFQFEKDTRCLTHLTSKNSIDQTNKGIIDERNAYYIEEKRTDIPNESVSTRSRSKSPLILDYYSGESLLLTANQCNLTDEFSLASDYDRSDLVITQIDAISQLSNMTIYEESASNSQINQIQWISSNAYDDNFEFQIDDSGSNTCMNNVTVKNLKYDSAYSTSNTDMINSEILDCTDGKCISEIDTGYRFKLRSYEKKTIIHEDIIDSSSIIRGTKTHRRQSFISLPEKHTLRCLKDLSKEERINMEATISANWLNFTLESLNVEQVIIESLKVILSVLCDKRTASDYLTRRCWKNTLEEEAVNAALNMSDILIMEKKPNICAKEITMTIIESLHEITMCIRLNQTSMWIYRVQIIFELCNSLSICVEIIDQLITKLKSYQFILINAENIRQDTHAMINRLHLLFYALNIAVRKYRTIVPRDQEFRFTEKTIPHVTDLWRRHHIHDEIGYTSLNLDIMQTRWLNALENFTSTSIDNFVQFAEKSLSLFHLLKPQ